MRQEIRRVGSDSIYNIREDRNYFTMKYQVHVLN